MIITNGKVLIHSRNSAEELAKAVRKAQNFLEEDRALEAVFLLNDRVSYPCYVIPEGVTFADLDMALRPNIKLRAINEDIIVLPEREVVTKKHYFSEEELADLAGLLTKKRVEMMKLEKQKASVMKDYTAKNNSLDGEVLEMAMDYDAGHQEREYVCLQKLNFADGYKYYVDVADEETIRDAAPMEASDRQMRIDVHAEPLHDPRHPADEVDEPFFGGPDFPPARDGETEQGSAPDAGEPEPFADEAAADGPAAAKPARPHVPI